MGLDRNILERQLSLAKAQLQVVQNKMDAAGVEVKQRRRDPLWRSANATCRQITRRINAMATVEKRDEALAAAKAGGNGNAEE
jgi:hypothetical protein